MDILAFYGRVSTDSEEQKRSIGSQVSFYEQYLGSTGSMRPSSGVFYRSDGTYENTDGYYIDEGFSGAKSNKYRKAFQQLLTDAKLGKFNAILCKNISRFGRNTKEILQAIDDLRILNVAVIFDDLKINTLNRADDFKLTIFAAQAQEDSRSKSESVQFGKYQGYKKGIWGGRAPYGYDIEEGRLIRNEVELDIVIWIYELYLEKSLGLGAIARQLTREKIKTKTGKSVWDQSAISKILINRIYIGEIRLHRTKKVDIIQNLIKQIPYEQQIIIHDEKLRAISDEVFNLVQIEKEKRFKEFGDIKYKNIKVPNEEGVLKDEKMRVLCRASGRHSTKHIFSNIIKCGNCGGSLRKKVQKNKYREFLYWICRNNEVSCGLKCGYRNLQYEENLVKFVKEEIEKYRTNDIDQTKYFNYLLKTNVDLNNIEQSIEEAEGLIANLKNERELNFKLLSKETISEEEYDERNQRLGTELRRTESDLRRYLNLNEEIDNTHIRFKHFCKSLIEIDVENLDNALLRKIINKIIVTTPIGFNPTQKFRAHKFYPEHITIDWNFMGLPQTEIVKDYAEHIVDKYID
ncbi:recombinase family protein [Paenibacillus chitinolyticus]|uniref:recombinase family protein n=1 Tax=Paenibacillus chitinolyticus TaxID=79263 RepID=UPI00366CAFA1